MRPRRAPSMLLATGLALGAAAILLSAAATAAPGAGSWPQLGRTAQHVGRTDAGGALRAAAVGRLAVRWVGGYGASAADESSPVVAHGVAYVAGFDGVLSAFALAGCGAALCDPLWQGRTGGDITATPAVVGGAVLVASADGFLYAFPARGCGTSPCPPSWKGALGAADVDSSVAAAAGRAYVGTFDGRVLAFDAGGCDAPVCRPRWTGQAHGHLVASPAVGGGSVFIGSDDGRLYVFAAHGCGAPTCAASWTAALGGPDFGGSPTVTGGTLFIASSHDPDGANDGHLLAFAAHGCGAATCQPLWRGDIGPDGAHSAPAVVGRTLLVTSPGTPQPERNVGVVQAFDVGGCGAPLCQPRWTGVNHANGAVSSPAVADGMVFVAKGPATPSITANVGLFAYRVTGCGARVCQPVRSLLVADSGNYSGSSVAIADGRLLFGANDNDSGGQSNLYALATRP